MISDLIALRRVERALERALLLVEDGVLKTKLQAQLKTLKTEILRLKLNSATKQEKRAC